MDKTPCDSNDSIQPLCGEDGRALATSFDQHRERLRHMVDLGRDPRIRVRLDASDVVQDEFRVDGREHDGRPSIVDTFFALAQRRRAKPPGQVRLGIPR